MGFGARFSTGFSGETSGEVLGACEVLGDTFPNSGLGVLSGARADVRAFAVCASGEGLASSAPLAFLGLLLTGCSTARWEVSTSVAICFRASTSSASRRLSATPSSASLWCKQTQLSVQDLAAHRVRVAGRTSERWPSPCLPTYSPLQRGRLWLHVPSAEMQPAADASDQNVHLCV